MLVKIKYLVGIIIIGLLVPPMFCLAENPIISQRYTADPVGLEYKGRLYVYTSHDIDGQERYWMNDITCLSTTDMQNWTDHGEVFKAPENIPWVTQAWAPTVVERYDKFYMYTGDGNRSISVAVTDSPTGPFIGHGGKPLITRDLPNADVIFTDNPVIKSELGVFSYLHKVKDGRDIYFFANSSDNKIDTEVLLRGKLKLEGWNPRNGLINIINVFRTYNITAKHIQNADWF